MLPSAGQASEFFEDKATGLSCGQFWSKRRKPTGDKVSIHEMDDPNLAKQKFSGERGLPRAIWSGDNNATRMSSWSVVHSID